MSSGLYLISAAIGGVGQFALLSFTCYGLLKGISGRALLICTLATFTLCASALIPLSSGTLYGIEFAVHLLWTLFVLRILNTQAQGSANPQTNLRGPLIVMCVGAVATAAAGILLSAMAALSNSEPVRWIWILQILQGTIALTALEQHVRNGIAVHRWRSRFFNIALGTLFAFVLIRAAVSLLLSDDTHALSATHYGVFGLVAPLFIIGSLRNKGNDLAINVSHAVVFRSATMILAGLLLIALGILGYFAQLLGSWLAGAYALLATAAIILFFVLMGSEPLRRRIRVHIAKSLFEYKYDYREEWLRLTQVITSRTADHTFAEQTLEALINILHNPWGVLWQRQGEDGWRFSGGLHANVEPLAPDAMDELTTFFEDTSWVLDLGEPSQLALLPAKAREGLKSLEVGYLVPLYADNELFAVAVLSRASRQQALSWEDFDLLKLVGNQFAALLKLRAMDEELQTARQFQAMNQVSAFVAHDVKTVASQLRLVLDNADRHRHKPEFVEDAIETVRNSNERLKHVLAQLQQRGEVALEPVNVAALLSSLSRAVAPLNGTLSIPEGEVLTLGDRDRLHSALSHLLNNAKQAATGSAEPGRVDLALSKQGDRIQITLSDNGLGMSQEFIQTRLFQPFETTKGVNGMGIGAFQAREYVRAMGGELIVESEVGQGTSVRVLLPMEEAS